MKRTFYVSFIATLVAFCFSTNLGAQEEDFDRNHVFSLYVGNISYSPKSGSKTTSSKVLDALASVAAGEYREDYDGYADGVRAEILRGLSWAFRFNVIDRDFLDGQDNPDYSLYLDGTISSITTTTKVITREKKEKNGKVKKITENNYRAVILFTLNLKDLQSGTIINCNTFSIESNDYSGSWFASRQKALEKAVSYVARYVSRYYDEVYPLTADIIEVGAQKNDRQKEVYIDLGSNHGVYEDLTFGVYKLKTIAGRDAKTYLGRIRVKKVEGPEVSFCKVVSGGKDIKKCLDNNDPLLIISRH